MTTPRADVLRPSPLDLGGVIGGAFRILRQRLGQFALLALIPSAIMFVLLIAALVPLIMGIISWTTQSQFSWLVVLGVGLLFAAAVVGCVAQIKVQAMMTLGAFDVIHQRPSGAAELFRRTAGVVGRVILLVLLGLAAVFLVYGLILGVGIAAAIGTAASLGAGSSDPGAAFGAIAAIAVVIVLLFGALSFAMVYLAVRFIYFLPALAVEQQPAVAALKRSWQLTRGNVLRTFGYYLVASLLISLASSAVSLIGQLFWLPAISASSGYAGDPTAQMLAILPGVLVSALLSFAVQVLALPFLTSYITVMYADQVRRNDLPAIQRPPAFPPPAAPGAQSTALPYGAPGQWQPVNPPQQQWGPQQHGGQGRPGGDWGQGQPGGDWGQQPPTNWR